MKTDFFAYSDSDYNSYKKGGQNMLADVLETIEKDAKLLGDESCWVVDSNYFERLKKELKEIKKGGRKNDI